MEGLVVRDVCSLPIDGLTIATRFNRKQTVSRDHHNRQLPFGLKKNKH